MNTVVYRSLLGVLCLAVLPNFAIGQGGLANESRLAADYLNQVRANPAAFASVHRSFADPDVQSRPALTWNAALQRAAERKAQYMAQTGQFSHYQTVNGQQVSMNRWMREAGYALAPSMPDDVTNFECIYGEQGRPTNGIGQRVMNSFFSEGKDGGHVLPILGRGFWEPCRDIGIGMARAESGWVYVSVLVGVYDPFNPSAVPPNQPDNPTPPSPPIPPAGISQALVTNPSALRVPVTYTVRGNAGSVIVEAGQEISVNADIGSSISYLLPTGAGSVRLLADGSSRLDIPSGTCTLTIQNTSDELITVQLQRPELGMRDGQNIFVLGQAEEFQMGAASVQELNVPQGTRVRVSSEFGVSSRVANKSEVSITYPPQ